MRDPFRNFNVYKIDPLSEIRNAGIVTNGEVYWVSSENDSDHRERTDLLGNTSVKTSLQAAINATENDANDYVLVLPTDGGTVRAVGTAIDFNKRRVHTLGLGAKSGQQTGNGLAFQGYVAANGIDTELAYVSAQGQEIGGLKFLGTSGTAAGGTITALFRVGTASSGTPHDLWMHDVTVEANQAESTGGTSPLLEITGDVATGIRGLRFERCWIGNFSWAPTPVVSVSGTAGPSRAEFLDCTFVVDSQATTERFVTWGTGVTEYGVFKNCDFINVEAGTAPASVISGALLVDNPLLVLDCKGLNVTNFGTDTELFVSPIQSGTAGAGMRNPGIAIIGTAGIVAA